MFARIVVIVALAVLAWSVVARPSGAHGDRTFYRVRAHDTLWTIASRHYDGDVRAAVWRIERTNGLRDPTVRPGETIVLP
jgi:nucleoid-associated protein YgaU